MIPSSEGELLRMDGRARTLQRPIDSSHQDANPVLIQRRTKQNEPTENGEGLQKVRLGPHATKFVYRSCLALFALCLATMTCTAQNTATLQSLAGKLNLTMGAGASDPEQLKDPKFAAIASAQYGALEPGNSMKMYALEPSQGQYSFSSADTVAAFAQAHGLHVTASAPIWGGKATDYGTGNPQWLMQGHFSATQLQSILQQYIETIMQHDRNKYPGVVNRWAIVSEATHLCAVFCQGLGKDASGFPAYIALAYRYARKADPTVQLCYDDWEGEGSGSTSDAVYHLVSYLKSQGLIDCVGFEGQWEGEAIGGLPRAPDIVANINRLGALGLDVYFSQVEIGLHTSNRTTANNPSDLTTQAKEYATLLQVCLSTHACTGFFTWGITERDSFCWKPGYCVPLLV